MSLFNLFSSKKKILIVEDDKEIMDNYKSFFNYDAELTKQFDFMYAEDKAEFLAQHSKADAVISDYYMDDLKFEEVWQACANKKPLVLITGEIVKKFSGPTATKPVSLKNLKYIVANIFVKNQICPEFRQKVSTSGIATKKAA